MGAPRIKTSDLAKLYQEKTVDSLQDKKIIESLQKRLNDKIQNDHRMAKKAALIIEQWLKKPKP